MQHYIPSDTRNQIDPRTHHNPEHNPYTKQNNHMLSDKAPAEELDENSHKRLQKIVGKFLYYARAIGPTMLMALNYLSEVQTNPTIDTAKQISQFLNYLATHPDAVTEYRRSGMILHIYSGASYISYQRH